MANNFRSVGGRYASNYFWQSKERFPTHPALLDWLVRMNSYQNLGGFKKPIENNGNVVHLSTEQCKQIALVLLLIQVTNG